MLLRSFLGQYDASRRPDDGDSHVQVSTLSVSLAIDNSRSIIYGLRVARLPSESLAARDYLFAHCIVQHWIRLSVCLLISQVTLRGGLRDV